MLKGGYEADNTRAVLVQRVFSLYCVRPDLIHLTTMSVKAT